MAKKTSEITKRDVQTLTDLKSKLERCNVDHFSFDEQSALITEIEDFFSEEIEAAMNYTGRLPSYYNCGGASERRELLKQEAFLIILEHLHSSAEEMSDYEEHLQGFRKAIFEKLYACTQQAQRESIHVDVKKDKKTNENEQCTVLSGGKDITSAACNPNFENTEDASEDADSVMNCNMGPFQSF